MSENVSYMVYRNRFNEVKPFTLIIFESSETHLKVRDLLSGQVKTLRQDRVIEVCNSLTDATRRAGEEQINYTAILRPENKSSAEDYSKIYNFNKDFEVCFTGFKKSEKGLLTEIAFKNNCFVRKSVSKKLGLLVCGDNVGPIKLQTAREMDVPIVWGVVGFELFLETGEIQE